ncbi:hypothetical protein [Lysinibacillus sp. K60]|uniref:hypothetical protein n=1 Tax=Lysinibacillus sp. K60 TaxID=2720027 RepID=UPI001C8C8841|nr:hypothetical protein [Lysinibacillus sp. K60]MBX8942563.1 hypothetical protein [Lysinibacillus sp. K60]
MVIANILFDNNGNFIWVSITAIAAVIAIFINTFIASLTTKANFKANIVAKSRIEWIQEVREKSAEFITSCYDLTRLLDLKYFSQEDADINKEIIRLRNEVQKNGTLLMLYFGPDSSENNEMITVIIQDLIALYRNESVWTTRDDLFLEINLLNVLKDFLRIYFKAEWKRAIGELEDSQVQDYLTKNKVYRKIRHIFRKSVAEYEQDAMEYYEYLEKKMDSKRP